MKLTNSNRRNVAMTLIEVLVVVFVIAVLAAIMLPPLSESKSKDQLINCRMNLKQMAIAFRIWEGDSIRYPMRESIKRGGAMELVVTGNVAAVFQVMSNELSTTKILICPTDTNRVAAANWTTAFGNKNISYFVGLDAADEYPASIIAGDDNLQTDRAVPVKSGVLELTTNTPIAWTSKRHQFKGNIALTDASVSTTTDSELANTIIKQYEPTAGFTNRFRIAIP